MSWRPSRPPAEDLEQLLEGADATGQRDERVGEVGHLRLALVHRVHLDEPRHSQVGDLAREEAAGDDADHLATGSERPLGQQPHQPDLRAAVHDADAARDQGVGELSHDLLVPLGPG